MKINKKNILSLALFGLLILEMNAFSQSVGETAPDFTLTTIDDSQFKLSNNSGKVVFIFLFGYSCPHCLANGNNTETGIYDIYKGNPDFVAIGIDTWDGSNSAVENFINQTGITYPVAVNGSSIQALYSSTYDRIIVVDQNGIIKYKASSNATTTVVNEAKQVINGLLTVTDVEDVKLKKELLKVYPIPAQETIYIENSSTEPYSALKIINSSGKVVVSKSLSQKDMNHVIEIPVNNLNNGIYIVKLISSKNIQSRRIIIANN